MRYFLSVFLVCFGFFSLSAQTDKEKSVDFARKGIKLVDLKKYDEGIAMFRKGAALDTGNSLFYYEIATAFYMQEKFDSVILIMRKVLDKPDANDQFYQILGNAFDMKKESERAMETYRAGLKKFPASGILYLECGIVMQAKDSTQKAIEYWERGVNADPGISSNYYYLAKAYAAMPDKTWALLYGEVFMNIERNSKRSEEMSKILFDASDSYLQNIAEPKAASAMSDNSAVKNDNEKNPVKPFNKVFGQTMLESYVKIRAEEENIAGIALLYSVDCDFVKSWYSKLLDKSYPNIIFNLHKELIANGYFEAYLHWLFMKGNEKEFALWYNAHVEKYKAFVAWFTKNPMKINAQNFISGTKY
ncbi:MAG: hypothetical protein WCM76_05560 [Bacteroidota bacterium]